VNKNLTILLDRQIAFYVLRQDDNNLDRLGGTGIEFVSMVNFLQRQNMRVRPRFIYFPPARDKSRNILEHWRNFLSEQLEEIRNLIIPGEKTLLFVYPKMPFLGYSGDLRSVPFAVVGYILLSLKKKLTHSSIVLLISDMPIEQRLLTKTITSSSELDRQLERCTDQNQLGWKEKVLAIFEKFIFKRADAIISLSPKMTEHILRKHAVLRSKIILRGRNLYLPVYSKDPEKISLDKDSGLRIFYSGDLIRDSTITNLKKIFQVVRNFPSTHFYLCGRDGEWIVPETESQDIHNVHYLGPLDYATHDAIAHQCDVGLIVYSIAYAHLVPTAKYSAYIANGLAVLSTNLITLSQIIQEDGTGISTSIEKLPTVLAQWLEDPKQIKKYKERAAQLSIKFTKGVCMQFWFDELFSTDY
jgi:hypothetical protein